MHTNQESVESEESWNRFARHKFGNKGTKNLRVVHYLVFKTLIDIFIDYCRMSSIF